MKQATCVFVLLLTISIKGFTQESVIPKDSLTHLQHIKDSIAKDIADSIRWAKIEATGTLPLIKLGGKDSKVFPVKDIDEMPSLQHRYKLLLELTYHKKDSTFEKINAGLAEISRVINLHIAAGIPLSRMDLVVVAHGGVLYDLLTDTAYKVKNNTGKVNPNTKLIDELMNNGVRFIACGQAMLFTDTQKGNLHQGIKVALTAQVVLSDYIGRGYVRYDISNEE